MSVGVFIARPKAGTVGETRRKCHLFPVLDNVCPAPERAKALCGADFAPGDLEQMERIAGMPCELCVVRSPGPSGALPTGTPNDKDEEPTSGHEQ